MRDFARDMMITVVVGSVICLLLGMVGATYTVNSNSMYPQLQINERVLINKMAYNFSEPTRGELVYFKDSNGGSDQMQRVIGLPGDVIEVKNNEIYINGLKLTEPYVQGSLLDSFASFQVPADNYFLLSNNRSAGVGSTMDSTVPRKNIEGRAWIFLWPPDKWGDVDGYVLDSELASVKAP